MALERPRGAVTVSFVFMVICLWLSTAGVPVGPQFLRHRLIVLAFWFSSCFSTHAQFHLPTPYTPALQIPPNCLFSFIILS